MGKKHRLEPSDPRPDHRLARPHVQEPTPAAQAATTLRRNEKGSSWTKGVKRTRSEGRREV